MLALSKNKLYIFLTFSGWSQWDEDSLESASEKSAGSLARRIELPSPRITRISPLSLQKERKFMKRRRMKKWTLEEENMLREAVSKWVNLFSASSSSSSLLLSVAM